MSRERAIRRAEREAEAAARRAHRARVVARRQRRRALLRRLTPRLPDRRTGRLSVRRTRTQRAGIALCTLAALGVIWTQVESLGLRVALTLLTLLALPALVIIALGRRRA